MKKFRYTAIVALLVAITGTAACTGGMGGYKHGKRQFEKVDSNDDGKISEMEFLAGNIPFPVRIDTDGDGNVTREEAIGLATVHIDKIFSKMDADKDGTVSKAEIDDILMIHFKAIDADGDKFLTKSEIRKSFKRLRDRKKKHAEDGMEGWLHGKPHWEK